MEIKGKKTENNLRSAISGEAQAALLYELFANRARRDGFEEIGKIFEETAQNERAHAKIYLDLLQCIHTTDKNLESAADTEKHENSVMYPQFAADARLDGLEEVAKTFEMVGQIEAEHEKRFRDLLCQLNNNSYFSKGMNTEWICKNCGHRHTSSDAPDICPVCKHPKAFFAPLCENL